MEYLLEHMSVEAFDHVYTIMKQDFIGAELKPKNHLRTQLKEGKETGWLLLADGEEAGYALVIDNPSIPFVLLDYLATYVHGRGDGTAFLKLLQEKYPQGIIVEAEAEVPNDSEEENETRRRRMSFYQHAGFIPCSFSSKIFGISYTIHVWTPKPDPHIQTKAAQALNAVYSTLGPKFLSRRFVHIDIPEESSISDKNNDSQN